MPSDTEQETEKPQFDAFEMDSLHILPLGIIPFETSGVKRAKLVKNAQVQSVIEAFNEEGVGQAQVDVRHAAGFFGWEGGAGMKDRSILEQLAKLYSYDVYSLRIELRRMEIPLADAEHLQLSESTREKLGVYMKEFTRPLIEKVFGGEDGSIKDMDDIVSMFRSPDREAAIKNLSKMAKELNIEIHEIPDFLEEYGDIYLSLSYYNQCLDEIVPNIEEFYAALKNLRGIQSCSSDRNLMKTCDELEEGFQNLTASLTGRFESFERRSNAIWDNADASSFGSFRDTITSHHTTLGGVLCGLAVKMNLWDKQFSGDRGGPVKQGEFIRSHMREGMDIITKIEESAPSLSDL